MQFGRPTARHKSFESRSFLADHTAGTVPREELRFIGPGEDDLLHGTHGGGEILPRPGLAGTADENCNADQDASVTQIQANVVRSPGPGATKWSSK